MSSINKYELLKTDGTWIDRLKYILSLSDKTEIEKYLKESLNHLMMIYKCLYFYQNQQKMKKIYWKYLKQIHYQLNNEFMLENVGFNFKKMKNKFIILLLKQLMIKIFLDSKFILKYK